MASLAIPLAVWKSSFEFDHSCYLNLPKEHAIIVGLNSGLIVKVEYDDPPLKHARISMVLSGHYNPITEIINGKTAVDQEDNGTIILTLDRVGELSVWNAGDGRCMLHNATAFEGEAKGICTTTNGQYIIIYGYGSAVNILKTNTLDLVQSITLAAQTWISRAQIIAHNDNGLTDVVLFPIDGKLIYTFILDETTGYVANEIHPMSIRFAKSSTPSPCIGGSLIRWSIALQDGNIAFANSTTCWHGKLDLEKNLIVDCIWNDPLDRITEVCKHGDCSLLIRAKSGNLISITPSLGKHDNIKSPILRRDNVLLIPPSGVDKGPIMILGLDSDKDKDKELTKMDNCLINLDFSFPGNYY